MTIFDTPDMLAQSAAAKILDLVSKKPSAVICIASGDTPRLTNKHIVAGARARKIDFSRVQFISLDEWVGVPPSNSGSCYHFLHETIFEPLSVPVANIHFFHSTVCDLTAECERINMIITQLNGIDCMLVGVGMNGHIGFNEPGISPGLSAHVIELDPITQRVGQKYFSTTTLLQKGITLGLAQFMQSRMAILLATGSKKALVIKKALAERVSVSIPASLIQEHKNAFVMLDSEAAALLSA